MHNQIRHLVDNFSKEDFRALSSGIGIYTKYSKKNSLVTKRDFPKNKARVNVDKKIINENKNSSELNINSFTSSLEDKMAINHQKTEKPKFRMYFFTHWLFRKLFHVLIDVLVVCATVVAVGSGFLHYKNQINPSLTLSYIENIFFKLSLENYMLLISVIFITYGLLFQLLVGATLGQVISEKLFRNSKH